MTTPRAVERCQCVVGVGLRTMLYLLGGRVCPTCNKPMGPA